VALSYKKDRVPSKGLRERLGLDDIVSVLQQEVLQERDCEKRLSGTYIEQGGCDGS